MMGEKGNSADLSLKKGVAAYQQAINSRKPQAKDEKPAQFAGKPAFAPETFIKIVKDNQTVKSNQIAKGNEAQRFLRETLGEEKGDALYKTTPKIKKFGSTSPFDFLEDFNARQLELFFRNEGSAAAALVLSRLPSKLTADVLANSSPERKAELIKRIAHLGETSPEVLERVAAALREKARCFSISGNPEDDLEVDGMDKLRAILKVSGADFGEKLIDDLSVKAPGLSRTLRDDLYTLEDTVNLPDRVIEEKLRTLSDDDIILLLSYPLESFKQKIVSNLSEGREARVREEAEFAGPAAKIEVDAAIRDFLAWFRSTGPWLD